MLIKEILEDGRTGDRLNDFVDDTPGGYVCIAETESERCGFATVRLVNSIGWVAGVDSPRAEAKVGQPSEGTFIVIRHLDNILSVYHLLVGYKVSQIRSISLLTMQISIGLPKKEGINFMEVIVSMDDFQTYRQFFPLSRRK